MKKLLSLILGITLVLPTGAFAKSELENRIVIETIMVKSALYSIYKKRIENRISIEEQLQGMSADSFDDEQWDKLLDSLIQERIIFEHNNEKEIEKAKKGLKNTFSNFKKSMRTNARNNGAVVTLTITHIYEI
jgi:CRISPR/Cas system CMR-associated protein Cmr5 small subunit